MSIILTIAFFIATIYIFMKMWPKWAPKHFYMVRSFNLERIPVGESIRLTTEMTNKKILPLPWIKLRSHLPNSFIAISDEPESTDESTSYDEEFTLHPYREHEIVTSLLFYEKVSKHETFKCIARGYFKLDASEVEFGDLFGLYTSTFNYMKTPTLYVHPRIHPIDRLLISPNGQLGAFSVKRWILPDPILAVGTRDYTHNDSFRSISWQATAKVGKLQVKNMDFSADQKCMIYLDVQTSPRHWEGIDPVLIEKSIELTASVFDYIFKQKYEVGLAINSADKQGEKMFYLTPSYSPTHILKALDALALATEFRGVSMLEILKKASQPNLRDNLIILITGNLSDDLISELNSISKFNANIKVIATVNHTKPVRLNRNIDYTIFEGFADDEFQTLTLQKREA
ncbi:DUF58 domain-containing protein [Fusibacter bizertensis]|uniref:DUF58 domain-containing protein n=1 Tax=Fusibacter bizertensis TaxID=1488331 RepID=A0ABT6NBJ8_9FIRM|nr:DUF58 domain-containing protein [Fusibacter bizertensis]MDH8677783.1 DUF58 domain-containing protein [Fusibacter bizertensis]